MPTPTKYRNNNSLYGARNEYSSQRLYSGTGTIYDIPVEYPRRKTVPLDIPQKKTEPVRKAKKTTITDKKKLARFIVYACIFFGLCFTVLFRNALILQSNQEIKALEEKRNMLLAENQAVQSRIDRQLEINEIEEYAGKELGMMKPQAYQIFYIDMDMSDGGDEGTISMDAASSLQGIPGALVNAFKVLK